MLLHENAMLEDRMETYEFDLVNGIKGPIDTLLEMLDEHEVDIKDIFLSNITEQYLKYVSTLQALDLEKASSFAYYAAVLLDLKVRTLLPKTEEEEIQLEEDKGRLINELEMRKLLNEMRAALADKEVKYRYFVEPEYTEEDCRCCLNNFSLEELINAYINVKHIEAIREVGKKPQAKTIAKDRFTVLDKTKELVLLLREKREALFSEIAFMDESYTRSERINAFLALLELLRRQFVTAEQEIDRGEIRITITENADEMGLDDLFKGDFDTYEFADDKKTKKSK